MPQQTVDTSAAYVRSLPSDPDLATFLVVHFSTAVLSHSLHQFACFPIAISVPLDSIVLTTFRNAILSRRSGPFPEASHPFSALTADGT